MIMIDDGKCKKESSIFLKFSSDFGYGKHITTYISDFSSTKVLWDYRGLEYTAVLYSNRV